MAQLQVEFSRGVLLKCCNLWACSENICTWLWRDESRQDPHAIASTEFCLDDLCRFVSAGKMLRAERMPDRQLRAVGPLARINGSGSFPVSHFTRAQFPK
jgi:hypothetical protein